MNKEPIKIALSIAVGVVLVLVFIFFTEDGNLGTNNINRFTRVATSSAISVGVTPTDNTLLLATSTSRKYAIFVNTDANYVCLQFKTSDSDPVATDCQGIYLAASGGTYEIDFSNLYAGPIFASSNTATSVVTVLEVK